jgi:hypothetical protein
MAGQVAQRDGLGDGAGVDRVVKRLAERVLERTGDEVVGLLGADVGGALCEVPVVQVVDYGLWPAAGHSGGSRHLLVKQLWRPATEVQRTAGKENRTDGPWPETGQRLVETVAGVATGNVEGEIGPLGPWTGRHCRLHSGSAFALETLPW